MDSRAVMVGVLLARRPGELGEWLADASAFEAAGAAALWVDPAPESELDPLALLAALAALTSRSLLVAALPAAARPSGALASTLATVGRLSHGRLGLLLEPEIIEPERPDGLALDPALVAGFATFRRLPGEPGAFECTREGHEAERWIQTPSPEGRAAWRAALDSAGERGADGLLVPAGPRLLDILRNPDDPGERRDLQLAHG